jgi:hypothetical protein
MLKAPLAHGANSTSGFEKVKVENFTHAKKLYEAGVINLLDLIVLLFRFIVPTSDGRNITVGRDKLLYVETNLEKFVSELKNLTPEERKNVLLKEHSCGDSGEKMPMLFILLHLASSCQDKSNGEQTDAAFLQLVQYICCDAFSLKEKKDFFTKPQKFPLPESGCVTCNFIEFLALLPFTDEELINIQSDIMAAISLVFLGDKNKERDFKLKCYKNSQRIANSADEGRDELRTRIDNFFGKRTIVQSLLFSEKPLHSEQDRLKFISLVNDKSYSHYIISEMRDSGLTADELNSLFFAQINLAEQTKKDYEGPMNILLFAQLRFGENSTEFNEVKWLFWNASSVMSHLQRPTLKDIPDTGFQPDEHRVEQIKESGCTIASLDGDTLSYYSAAADFDETSNETTDLNEIAVDETKSDAETDEIIAQRKETFDFYAGQDGSIRAKNEQTGKISSLRENKLDGTPEEFRQLSWLKDTKIETLIISSRIPGGLDALQTVLRQNSTIKTVTFNYAQHPNELAHQNLNLSPSSIVQLREKFPGVRFVVVQRESESTTTD